MDCDQEKSREQLLRECQTLREQVEQYRHKEAQLAEECRSLRTEMDLYRDEDQDREQIISDLRLSERRLSTLAESTDDCVWELNEDLRYTYVSPRVKGLLGYSPKEVIGLTPFDLMPPEEARLAGEAFREFLRQGRLFTGYENQKWHKNGHRVYLESMGVPTYDGGRVVGFRGVDRNISLRKKAQERLRTAHKELARRVEERTAELREEIAERKRIEQQLRESRRRLSTLMDNLPGMVYRCRNVEEWTMEVVSGGVRELTGYEAEQIVENRELAYHDLIHPDDREEVWAGVQEAVRKERPYILTYRIRCADGTVKWVWEQGRVVERTAGQPEVLEGFAGDITRLKRTEEALRESEQRYRSLVENLPAEILIAKADPLRFVYANADGGKLLGYATEELLEMSPAQMRQLIHPADREMAIGRLRERLRGDRREERVYEMRVVAKDGTIRWARLFASRIVYEGEPAVQGVFFDVTEQKETERALRQARERYETLVENSIQGMVVFGGFPPTIEYVNFGFSSILGYSREEILSFSAEQIRGVIHPEDRDWVFDRNRRRLEGEEVPADSELRLLARDGSVIWVQVHAGLIDWQGEPFTMVTYVDITERKQREQELSRARRSLERLFEESQTGVVTLDRNMQVIHANGVVFEQNPGLDLAEAPRCCDLLPDREWEQLCERCPVRRAMQDGACHQAVGRIRRDGQDKVIRLVAVPRLGTEGEVEVAHEIIQKITVPL